MAATNSRYWGGPYDGEEVRPSHLVMFSAEAWPPIKHSRDVAARLVVHPLGSFERYVRVESCACGYCPVRYEWRGTFIPADA